MNIYINKFQMDYLNERRRRRRKYRSPLSYDRISSKDDDDDIEQDIIDRYENINQIKNFFLSKLFL